MPATAPKPGFMPRASSRPITAADVLDHLRPELAPELTVADLAQAYLDAAEGAWRTR